jgi:hypothetical protein
MKKSSRSARLYLSGAAAVAAVAGASAALALAGPASASAMSPAASHGYSFQTLNNHKDNTFNQLLGINQAGLIAGYFGSGTLPKHPNKGYLLQPPYMQRDFINENFPGSVQTQVIGLNNVGNTVGFWVNGAGVNKGFYTAGTHFYSVVSPNVPNSNPAVDQLLGINNAGVAVGFYTNKASNNRGFTYNIHTHVFKRVLIPGAPQGLNGPSLTAAGINNHGDIVGFYVNGKGVTVSFESMPRKFITFAYPHASMTEATGINDNGVVVGFYQLGTGSSAKMHGFTWRYGHGFTTVNDPHGVNTTDVNGINDKGELVGFYVDSKGNTDGFLAKPRG